METSIIVDFALVALGAIIAFFVPQGSRRGKTRVAVIASFAVPLAFVAIDRFTWASTGKGLADQAACSVLASYPSCKSTETGPKSPLDRIQGTWIEQNEGNDNDPTMIDCNGDYAHKVFIESKGDIISMIGGIAAHGRFRFDKFEKDIIYITQLSKDEYVPKPGDINYGKPRPPEKMGIRLVDNDPNVIVFGDESAGENLYRCNTRF